MATKQLNRNDLAEMWNFPWSVMDVLIGGQSSIDMKKLRLTDWEEATKFLRSYGYDPDEANDHKIMHAAIVEALRFIEKYLMPVEWSEGFIPPDEILFCDDPRKLMLIASSKGPEHRLTRAWACSVLRVLHTIGHIEGVYQHINLDAAREQIMERFEKHIFTDEDEKLWLGTKDEKIELHRVEWKNSKTRDSIILKLLHKKANVAETIYDLMGIRIVTKRLVDTMMVIKYLFHFFMVDFPNCIPSRARNTLLDVDKFRTRIDSLREMLLAGTISPGEFEARISKLTFPISKVATTPNPHSSEDYRAIQLTCRQFIYIPNPLLGWLGKMRKASEIKGIDPQKMALLREILHLEEGWPGIKEEENLFFFFPYELQVLDLKAYEQNLRGDASHDQYKNAQIASAKKRILSEVLQYKDG